VFSTIVGWPIFYDYRSRSNQATFPEKVRLGVVVGEVMVMIRSPNEVEDKRGGKMKNSCAYIWSY
jgi:hypothetical protein